MHFVALISTLLGTGLAFNVYQDLHSKPKHNVAFREPISVQEAAEMTGQKMRLQGEDYICTIPNEPLDTSLKKAPLQIDMEEAQSTALTIVKNESVTDNCMYYQTGYWVYEICPSRVRQFHQDPKYKTPKAEKNTPEYILGREQEYAKISNNGDVNYLVERLNGGTFCDIVERRRTIDIQYMCPLERDSEGDSRGGISSVREVKTCHYVVVVHVPQLCNDVAFQPLVDDTAETEITCHRVGEPIVTNPVIEDADNSQDVKDNHDQQILELKSLQSYDDQIMEALNQLGVDNAQDGEEDEEPVYFVLDL